MAITRGTSARTASPTPSDNSDMYYEDTNNRYASLSPAPSQTADAFGWDDAATPTPEVARAVTPTPQLARASSPASVVEISMDDFPPLPAPAPTPATVAKPRAKGGKATKGKGKAKAVSAEPETHTNDNDNPFLAADTAHAVAASLGLSTPMDSTTTGASSSRRPAAGAGSPSKHLRANSAGHASSAPYADVPGNRGSPLDNPRPLPPPVAAPTHAPFIAPVATAAALTVTSFAAPAAAPTVAPAAAPIVAPIAAANVAPAAAAPVRAPAPDPLVAVAADAALALWMTADGLPPRRSYTPTPAGGFPAIVFSPEQLLHGVPAELIRMYADVAHPKFFIVVSGGNGAVMRTHGLIWDAIGSFINIDRADFTLGTPPTAANGTSSSLWLVADIPDHLAQTIVDNRIISSTNITLFPLLYNLPVIGFMGVFAGFTLPNTDAGANVARDLIRTAIAANNEIAQFVQTHRDALGLQVSAGEAWTTFLESVSVQGIVLLANDTNTVAWRLFVDPPTNEREFWGQLRRLFGKLNVMTALYGTARLQRAFRCRICPSIDHPTPLCPLPGLPGWLGPTPATIAALEDASRQAVTKAQEQMRLNTSVGAGSSRSGQGRNQGNPDRNPRRDGKGKKGGDYKGKGKRRERDDFL
ncbi:hypothetical protein B0H13DRAFT_1899657 [Mycena leptocephala]|nr:hypothetical protein B0H13DRAFT_1899657 [Mycena leptocephala]